MPTVLPSEYKGLVDRILIRQGVKDDLDLLWRKAGLIATNPSQQAVFMLNDGLDIAVGNVLRRLDDNNPPLPADVGQQMLSAIAALRRSGADQIIALNTADGVGALAGEITTRSTFGVTGFGPDPNDPLFYGIPRGIGRL